MLKYLPHKYTQVQECITNWIESGELKPGDVVPSERLLSEQFKVSRMTVRQAINNLVSYGVLVREQGLGTFVARPKIEYDIGQLVSFTTSAMNRGLKPSGKLIELQQIIADEKLSAALNITIGQKVYKLVRVRYANNEPLLLERCFFPHSRTPGIESFDLENNSIYQIWREKYNIKFGKMRQALEPVVATEFEAKALGVPIGFLLMLVERVSYDISGQPVEYAKDLHRSDKSRFIAELAININGSGPINQD